MTAPAKFLFDVDFGPGPAPGAKEAPTITAAAHEAALAEAEARGYRNGMQAAEAQARTEAERRIAAASERMSAALGQLQASLKTVENKFEAEAVEVAVAVGRQLATELIAREPFAEIAALAATCFHELIAAPHIVVRVHESLHAIAKGKLDEIARARHFEGRVVVLAEGGIAPGDCRIEWADGGMIRDRAATEQAIAEVVEGYVAARRAGNT